MREFLVRYFALSYRIKVFNYTLTFVRSANIIFPLFILTGTLLSIGNDLWISTMLLTITACFFGFMYFEFKPLTKEDFKYMDNVQKNTFKSFYGKPINGDYYNDTYLVFINPILCILSILILILK